MFNFNKFYAVYAAAPQSKKVRLLEELKVALYFNYRIFFDTDQDTASDFFCEFFDKVPLYIDRFQPSKAKFFTYLLFILQKSFSAFKTRRARTLRLQGFWTDKTNQSITDSVPDDDLSEKFYEWYDQQYMLNNSGAEAACDTSVLYHNTNNFKKLQDVIELAYYHTPAASRKGKYVEKILLLKYACFFSENIFLKLCELLELDTVVALEKLAYIKERMQGRFEKHQALEQRINGYFCKARISRNILSKLNPESYGYEYYSRKKDSYEKYLKQNTEKFLQHNMTPNCTIISETLGLKYSRVRNCLSRISAAIKVLNLEADTNKKQS